MKRILSLLLVSLLSIGLVACNNSPTNNSDSDTDSTKKETNKVTRDLKEGDYKEKGKGSFMIVCAGGSTENGNVPVEYLAPDSLSQIGYDASNFDGSKLSYIYINGILNTKEQLTEDCQGTINIEGDFTEPGIYKVEVVQYEDDDTSKGMVTYKTCEYEVKEQ
ncbi:hypothetical protein [Terrisporobacter mayombei]|nr:hypothetical protein [Terrisporobacter mayombei]MCC3870303.1 hypothetical protein [Terrisporobacter mayombei]